MRLLMVGLTPVKALIVFETVLAVILLWVCLSCLWLCVTLVQNCVKARFTAAGLVRTLRSWLTCIALPRLNV